MPYSVILPIQDVEALKRVSKKTGESVSVLIRAAIREYLNASNGGLSVRQIAEIKELVPQGAALGKGRTYRFLHSLRV